MNYPELFLLTRDWPILVISVPILRIGWVTHTCSNTVSQSRIFDQGDIFSILRNSRGIRKTFSWPAVWNWLNSNKEAWWGFMTWAIRLMKAVLHHVMALQMTWILYGIYTCYWQLPVKSIVVVLDKEDISQHPHQILYIFKHWSFTKFLKLQEAITHHIFHLSANRGIAGSLTERVVNAGSLYGSWELPLTVFILKENSCKMTGKFATSFKLKPYFLLHHSSSLVWWLCSKSSAIVHILGHNLRVIFQALSHMP